MAGRREQWPQAVLAPWAWHPEPGRSARRRARPRAGDGGFFAGRAGVVGIVLGIAFGLAGVVGWTTSAFSSEAANSGNTFEASPSFGCTPGETTVVATADTLVYEAEPTANFGTEAFLAVRSRRNENARSLVSFPLPAVPSDCSVTAATLSLEAVVSEGNRTIEAFQVATPWTETGATWSNQPATTGAAATSPSGAGLRTWDVTTQVQAMYANANHGFLLRDSVESVTGGGFVQAYTSREAGSDPPILTVTYT